MPKRKRHETEELLAEQARIKEMASMTGDELTEALDEEWDKATPEQRQAITTNLRSLFGVLH